MARLQIDLPERFGFTTDVQIYTSHINYGNHLDNAQLLTLVAEARLRLFRSLGGSEIDVEGRSIVIADMMVQYRSEAFHGEVMQVALMPRDFNRYGFDLVFRLTEQNSGREVARGKSGIVFVDKTTRKVTPMPEGFRAQLAAL